VFTGRVRSGWAVHDGKGFERSGGVKSGTVRQGSQGTDVIGWVGYGAAGSLHWCGEVW